MKYYKVTAKFGHVGRNNYLLKTVATFAESGVEAAEKIRWMPRVKHHRKDAIEAVKEISKDEYKELKKENDRDPYFKAKSKQEQKELCSELMDLVLQFEKPDMKQRKKERLNKIKFKMKKNKIIHYEATQSMRNYEAAFVY